jgi:hypothetical protein
VIFNGARTYLAEALELAKALGAEVFAASIAGRLSLNELRAGRLPLIVCDEDKRLAHGGGFHEAARFPTQ